MSSSSRRTLQRLFSLADASVETTIPFRVMAHILSQAPSLSSSLSSILPRQLNRCDALIKREDLGVLTISPWPLSGGMFMNEHVGRRNEANSSNCLSTRLLLSSIKKVVHGLRMEKAEKKTVFDTLKIFNRDDRPSVDWSL